MNSAASIAIIALVAFTVSAPADAGRAPRHLSCAAPHESDATKVWNSHRRVIRKCVNGKKVDIGKFLRSAEVLGSITGVVHDPGLHFVGPLPGERAAEDLAAWDRWFEENCHLLRLDQAGELSVRDSPSVEEDV